jgi:hypothetical protein
VVDIKLILIVIAFVLAIPVGTFLASLMSPRRARLLSLLGAVVAAALSAGAIYYFVRTISVDALSYGLGAFLAVTTGALIGALVVDFLVSLGNRRPGAGSLPLEL